MPLALQAGKERSGFMIVYVAQSGDTLPSVARRFHLAAEENSGMKPPQQDAMRSLPVK